MLQAAKFRTLTAIGAWLLHGESNRIGAAGNEIHFARDIRNPKTVDHVIGEQSERDGPPHRNMQLICRDEGLGRNWGVILDFPPPLLAGNSDIERLGGCG